MRERVPPFTGSQATLLAHFLSSPKRPKDTLSYPQLAGFLFSLGNGPELIPPSEWIPLVFNDQEALYETKDEAEQVLQAMMALYTIASVNEPEEAWLSHRGARSDPGRWIT